MGYEHTDGDDVRFVGIVVAQCDPASFKVNEALVRNRDAVRIEREAGEHPRSGKRLMA